MPKKTYTVKEVAKLLGFSTNTVYKYLDDGSIKAVRLGEEGRFRIPESEVESLLQERGKTLYSSDVLVPSENQIKKPFADSNIEIKDGPKLFDWFISFMSIALGFSIVVFPLSNATQLALSYTKITIPLQIILIIGGVAILTFDLFGFKGRTWRRTLHILVAVDFLVMAVVFVLISAIPLAIGYFSFAVAIIASLVTRLADTCKFVLLENLIFLLLGIGVLVAPAHFYLLNIFISKIGGTLGFVIIWLSLILFNAYINFIAAKKDKRNIWFTSVPAALLSLLYATYSFTQMYWSRAVFCVVVASFAILFPFANEFETFSLKSKKELAAGFAWLLALFTVGSLVVFLIYRSFQGYVFGEIADRLNTASDVVTNFMDGNIMKVTTFATDYELIEAMEGYSDDDHSSLANYNLKQLYQVSNWTILRAVLVDKNGNILDTYPYFPAGKGVSIADRDYFSIVKSEKKLYVSGIIKPTTHGASPTILVSAPILSKNGDFLGVLIGDVDVAEMTKRINQVRFGETGSYLIVDSSGNYIIPSEPNEILTKASPTSLESKAINGETGVIDGKDSHGVFSILSYKPVDKYGWGIVAQQPIGEAFSPYSSTLFILFLVLSSTGVGSLVMYLRFKNRSRN